MINVTRIFSQERLNIMNQNQINPEKEPLLSSSPSDETPTSLLKALPTESLPEILPETETTLHLHKTLIVLSCSNFVVLHLSVCGIPSIGGQSRAFPQ